jgi:hypothetical protein
MFLKSQRGLQLDLILNKDNDEIESLFVNNCESSCIGNQCHWLKKQSNQTHKTFYETENSSLPLKEGY